MAILCKYNVIHKNNINCNLSILQLKYFVIKIFCRYITVISFLFGTHYKNFTKLYFTTLINISFDYISYFYPLVLCAGAMTLFARVVLASYKWDWLVCIFFGTVLAATDPTAITEILKDYSKYYNYSIIEFQCNFNIYKISLYGTIMV